jgi:hypothetical protein
MQITINTCACVTPELFADYSENFWAETTDADYAFLTGPHNYPPACQWCGERGTHHPYCDEPRDLWDANSNSNGALKWEDN